MRMTATSLALALGLTLTAGTRAQQTPAPPTPPSAQPGLNFASPLYQNQGVARSLTISQDQINRLNAMNNRMQQRYQEQFNNLRDIPAEQRAAREREFLRNYNRDLMHGSDDVLNPRQRARYRQLWLQSQGVNAFGDADVQKSLNLTDRQLQQLKDLSAWSEAQQQAYMTRARTDREAAQRLYSTYQRELQNRVNSFLTNEQQTAWQTMTGEAYRFPPPFVTGGR